jgi:endogenous inhibitor of DNA gyrase (YacG/DUF329 family)
MRVMEAPCPTCRKKTPWEGNPHRPFCSERCKLLDLGKWLAEEYRIPAVEDEESEESGEPRH